MAAVLRCLALTVLGLSVHASAHAQSASLNGDLGMDAHFFRPAIDSKGYISTNGTSVLGDGDYSFGLILDLGLGIMPFDGFSHDGDTALADAETSDRLIDAAITGTLHFNYGIANTAVVGLQVPIQVIGGPNVIIPGVYNDKRSPTGLDSQGFGDITLHGKVRLLRHEQNSGIGVAGLLLVQLPTGETTEFRGDPGFGLWPVLAIDLVPIPELRFGLNAGYRLTTGDGATVPFEGRVRPVGDISDASTRLVFPDEICESAGTVTSATCPGPLNPAGTDVEYDDVITGGAAIAALRRLG
jgi:hypothetical protein